MNTLTDSVNASELFSLASSLFPEQRRCFFAPSPDKQDVPWCIETPGGVIFVLAFENRQIRLAIKIPLQEDDDDVTSWWMWSIQALRFVGGSFDRFPAPAVRYVDLDGSNPVGAPFMIIDWIEGSPMPLWGRELPHVSARMHFLDRFSDVFLDLALTPLKNNNANIQYYGKYSAW